MQLTSSYLPTGRVISIEADEALDLRPHGVFLDACRLADYPKDSMIDVTLMRTRSSRASGGAMLLVLHKFAGWKRSRIRLLNCHPEIRKQLVRSQARQQFHLV